MNPRVGSHHIWILLVLLIYCKPSLEEDLWRARQLKLDSPHSRTVSVKSSSGDPCRVKHDFQGDDDLCMIRGSIYNHIVYPHTTGCYCYFYTNRALLKPNWGNNLKFERCATVHDNATFYFPCFQETSTEYYLPFDYSNSKSVEVLDSTFLSSSTTQKWIQCAKDGYQCCRHMDKNSILNPGKDHCPAIWDGYTCFDKAQAGTIQHEACPSFMYSSSAPTCQQYNDKECFDNATWNQQTDYGPCTMNPIVMMIGRNSYYVIMLSISLGICIPALVIFISYRKLRITRVILHRNLIIAIIMRNTFYIAAKEAIILDALDINSKVITAIEENSVWCRTISFMEKFSCSVVYSCMLLESIFLHRIIAAALKGEPRMKYYYLIASGIAFIPVSIWTIFTALNNNVNCWQVDTNSYNYIVDGPRIATLVINALLMLDIVRVLCTKLKRINTAKSRQIRRMTQATILLIPLFGVQFLITTQRPVNDDCNLEQLYYYFFYTMDGLQGAIVALLYCYLNKEVQMQLLRTYITLMTRLYSLFGKEYVPSRRPTWAYSEHRVTATSFLNPNEMASRASASSLNHSGLLSDVTPSKPKLSVTFSESGHVYGNVNDILNQKQGLHTPRSSVSSPVGPLKGDNLPKRQYLPRLSNRETNKERKISSVAEENQEDVDETAISEKLRGSDDIQETPQSLQVDLGRSDEMLFRGGELSEVTQDRINLGFSISSENV